LYDGIFQYAAPIGIFFLLLEVKLKDLKFAGFPMLLMFFIGSAATMIAVVVGYKIVSPQNHFNSAYAVAGMYTGTYIGGSANLNAIALNYGARNELVQAMRRLADQVAAGTLAAADIDEQKIEAALDTHDLPPLDLLIRTSGEQRLSNFLLWQAAYAELLFVDTLWPDFDGDTMRAALAEYARRERRYGGL